MVIQNSAMVPRGSAGDGWKVALDTNAATAAFSATDVPQRPEDGLINLNLNRFVVLRAFLRDESPIPPTTGDANGSQATIDVYGWQNASRRAVLLARLVLTAGALQGVLPLHSPDAAIPASQADVNEVDTATYSTGLVAPDVRSYADGSCLIYLDACECSQVFCRVEDIAESTRLLLLGKGAADIPALVDTPFNVALAKSAAQYVDDELQTLAASPADMAAAGSGQEYVLQAGEISNAHATTAQTITLHTDTSGAGVLWGPHTIPANTVLPIAFNDLRAGDGKLIRVSSGGAFTGLVTVRGVKRPVR